MRITLSAAMRARDVSRPSDEQLAAAAKREEAASRAGVASRPAAGRPVAVAVARADVAEPIAAASAGPAAPAAPANAASDRPIPAPTSAVTPALTPAPTPPRRRRRRRS